MDILNVSEEVQQAISEKRPVVALESTIIAHGMPFPQNLETARRVEQTVRNSGAVPATCAVIGGKLQTGLSETDLERFAEQGAKIAKCSRRDLAYMAVRGLDGATTVAATIVIASHAGIGIFATGGIGGVHRGAGNNMDISADLPELANSGVAVVSAGAKSILDIGLTLEYLETYGVPVVGFGTKQFPAFYSEKSGFYVDFQMDSPEEIAKLIRVQRKLGLKAGILIVNPIPAEYAMPLDTMELTIAQAIADAEDMKINGKALTPFLLSRIEELTQGKSLDANIELVCHNAHLAAKIAVAGIYPEE